MSDHTPALPSELPNSLSSSAAVLLYRNHRVSALLLLLIVGAGCIALVQLPKLEDPPMSQRGGMITTLLPGADSTMVEAQVTEKIEAQLLELPELKKLRSQSRSGASVITFEIKDSVADPEFVFSRLRSKVQDAKASLPHEATEPVVEAIEFSAYAWIGAVISDESSPTSSPGVLRRLALQLSDQLRQVPRTRQTDLLGEPEEEITVELDPARAAQLGLSIAEIARSLNQGDAKQSAGTMIGPHQDVNVRIANQFVSIQNIADTHLRDAGDGRVLLLSDVAKIHRGVRQPVSSLAFVNGRPAIIVAARPEVGSSVDRWTKSVQARVRSFEKSLPTGVHLESLMVQNDYVTGRMFTLLSNFVVGLLAVAMTTVVFLGWRSALLVTATLPLGCLMVLAGLQWLKIPLHQMSVTGVILSLGLMIDNAIIVVDELGQFLRRGVRSVDAIVQTCRRLATPLLGSTATTVLAFVPLAFMPGPTGEFVGSIGVAVILSVISSLLISLTLLPALAIRLLDNCNSTANGQGIRLPRLEKWYVNVITRIVTHPSKGIALGVVLPCLGFAVAIWIPDQFFPVAERDYFTIDIELDASSSIQDTVGVTRQIDEVLKSSREFTCVSWLVGATGPAFYYNQIPSRSHIPSYAQAAVRTRAPVANQASLRKLQTKLSRQISNARVTVRQLEQGPPINAPIELRILGNDLPLLHDIGEAARRTLLSNPHVMQARSDMREIRPVANVTFDPGRLRAAGLDERTVGAQLYGQLDGLTAGSLIEQTEELPIRVRSFRLDANSAGQLDALSLVAESRKSQGGDRFALEDQQSIPLTALGRMKLVPQRAVITRFNGQRVNELQVYLSVGKRASEVLNTLTGQLSSHTLKLPSGYRIEWGGEAAEREASMITLQSFLPVVALAGIVILVLILQSFRMAFIIGSVGFLSIGLGTASLWFVGYPFGFTAIVGILGLVGVAINDSIVVLSALREDPRARTGDIEAIVQTVSDCTRHVLCTSFTTALGFLPLILGGGGFWPPMAVVIGCGVTGASLIAMTFIPCLYRILTPQRHPSPFDKMTTDSAIEQQICDQVVELISEMPKVNSDRPANTIRRVRPST